MANILQITGIQELLLFGNIFILYYLSSEDAKHHTVPGVVIPYIATFSILIMFWVIPFMSPTTLGVIGIFIAAILITPTKPVDKLIFTIAIFINPFIGGAALALFLFWHIERTGREYPAITLYYGWYILCTIVFALISLTLYFF